AYKNVLKYQSESSFNDFHNELLLKCQMHNAYINADDLLPYNEIKATAKSIAKFCWKEFSEEKLNKIQSKKQKARRSKRTEKQKLHTKTLLEKAIMINEE
nr:hypothetical protein [Klebsiella pneumoniae]